MYYQQQGIRLRSVSASNDWYVMKAAKPFKHLNVTLPK